MTNNKRKVKMFLLVASLVYVVAMIINRMYKQAKRLLDATRKENEKNDMLFHCAEEWLRLKIQGYHVEDYLIRHNYSRIAIYGTGYLGQDLIDELEDTSISIKYGIDRDAELCWATFPIIKPEEISECDFDDVDAVIVTAIAYYDEIKEQLSSKMKCPIISLIEVIGR